MKKKALKRKIKKLKKKIKTWKEKYWGVYNYGKNRPKGETNWHH